MTTDIRFEDAKKQFEDIATQNMKTAFKSIILEMLSDDAILPNEIKAAFHIEMYNEIRTAFEEAMKELQL